MIKVYQLEKRVVKNPFFNAIMGFIGENAMIIVLILLAVIVIAILIAIKKSKGKKILVLDTETTGITRGFDEVLELAIINGNGKTVFHDFFKPKEIVQWTKAQEIHGISPDDVKDKVSLNERAEEIQKIIRKSKTIVGYNVNFDLDFLESAGIVRGPKQDVVDVMELFSKKYDEKFSDGEIKNKKLETAAKFFNIRYKPHGALEDTKCTLKVYKKLK